MNFLSKDDMTAEQLYQVANNAYQAGSPWQLRTFEKDLANEYTHYIGLVVENQLIGFAGGVYLDNVLDISNVAIVKTQQGHHFGGRLLQAWFDEFPDETTVLLEVRTGNFAAKHLYQRFGFKIYRQRRAYYKQPVEDADLMMQQLPVTLKE